MCLSWVDMCFLVYLREHILFPRTSFAASPSHAVDFSKSHVMMSTPVINGLSIHFTYLLLSSNCSQNLPPWSSAFLLLNSVYGFLDLGTTLKCLFLGARGTLNTTFLRIVVLWQTLLKGGVSQLHLWLLWI